MRFQERACAYLLNRSAGFQVCESTYCTEMLVTAELAAILACRVEIDEGEEACYSYVGIWDAETVGGTWHASLQRLLSQSGDVRHDGGPPLLPSSERSVRDIHGRNIPRGSKHTTFAHCSAAVRCPGLVQSPLHVFQRHRTEWERDGRSF
jgi:hypothetical protein